jgi:hypothetical protein
MRFVPCDASTVPVYDDSHASAGLNSVTSKIDQATTVAENVAYAVCREPINDALYVERSNESSHCFAVRIILDDKDPAPGNMTVCQRWTPPI